MGNEMSEDSSAEIQTLQEEIEALTDQHSYAEAISAAERLLRLLQRAGSVVSD